EPLYLKRVRAVRADREQELEQELVGGHPFGVLSAAILAADLTELAGPVGQERRPAGVPERRIDTPLRPVIAAAGEPPPGELVFATRIHAECGRVGNRLLAIAPEQLGSADDAVVNRPPERPIPD